MILSRAILPCKVRPIYSDYQVLALRDLKLIKKTYTLPANQIKWGRGLMAEKEQAGRWDITVTPFL
jgi:hypothetical protein